MWGRYSLLLVLLIVGIVSLSGCTITGYVVAEEISATPDTDAEAQATENSEETKEKITDKIANLVNSNSAPEIIITEPDSGETITGNEVTIWWKARDPENSPVTISMDYRLESEDEWKLLTTNEKNDRSYDWDISSLPKGPYKVRVFASDGKKETMVVRSFIIQ